MKNFMHHKTQLKKICDNKETNEYFEIYKKEFLSKKQLSIVEYCLKTDVCKKCPYKPKGWFCIECGCTDILKSFVRSLEYLLHNINMLGEDKTNKT